MSRLGWHSGVGEMIALIFLLMLADAAQAAPPCPNGQTACKPWDRDWQPPQPSDWQTQKPNPFDRFDPKPQAFGGPAKLIVTWYQSGVTVINYPSQGRCEEARKVIDAEVQRRVKESAANPNFLPIGPSANGAFCIPG